MAVLGLLAQQPLKVESLQPEGSIPIDTAVLARRRLPPAAAESGAEACRCARVAAYYAPQGRLRAQRAVRQAAGRIGRHRQRAAGRRRRRPASPRRLGHDPARWKNASASTSPSPPAGRSSASPTPTRSRSPSSVTARPGRARRKSTSACRRRLPPGQEYRAAFHAVRTPPGWLADWKTQNVEFPDFPIFAAPDATHDEGALVVAARDDLTVRPEKIEHLVPLDENENGQIRPGRRCPQPGLSLRESALYGQRCWCERTPPRLTARTVSCFRVSRRGVGGPRRIALRSRGGAARGGWRWSCPAAPPTWTSTAWAARSSRNSSVSPASRRTPCGAGTCSWKRPPAARSAWPSISSNRCPAQEGRGSGITRCPWCRPPEWLTSRAWFPWKAAASSTCR